MVAWAACGQATLPLRILGVIGFFPFKLYENRAVTVSSFIPAAHAYSVIFVFLLETSTVVFVSCPTLWKT